MHLARFAVEAQGVGFLAADQGHRLSFYLSLHALHALGLLGAQVEREAQAVLGDHQRHFAGFLVRLVGGGDQLHAVLLVERARLFVVHVGQVAQLRFRVHRRRFDRRLAQRPLPGCETHRFVRFDRVAAQRVDGGRRHEPRLREIEFHVRRRKHGGAQLGQAGAQAGCGLVGLLRRLQRHRRIGHAQAAVFVEQRQAQAGAAFEFGQGGVHRHLAVCRFLVQDRFPLVVAVAVDGDAGLEAGQGQEGFVGEHAPQFAVLAVAEFFGDVGLHAHGLALVHVIQAVAVGQRGVRHHVEVVGGHAGDGAQFQAQVFRAVEGADFFRAAVGEVIGVAAIEVLLHVRREVNAGGAAGSALEFGTALENLVEQQAVMGGDVLHVAHVLVAAFDLERADAGIDQRFQVAALVVVLHRQQVLVVGDHAAGVVRERVWQAARLRAVAAVGAAARIRVRNVALAGKRHAQCAVHKIFERGVGGGVDVADLIDGQFAREHQLREAGVAEEFRLLFRADVALGAGVQLNRRQVHFHQAQVLHDQRIDAGLVQLPDLLARTFQFRVVQDGVERNENARMVAMRELHQRRDILDRVAGVMAGAKGGTADIDSIGAVEDGLPADFGGFGGRQQFELVG